MLASGFSGSVMGNGATIGRHGETVFPLLNKDIRMVSENITGSFVEQDEITYKVDCLFSFLNLTDQKKTIEIGFPILAMYADSYGSGSAGAVSDKDIVVFVNDKKVSVTARKGVANQELGIGKEYPLVFVFPVEFGPNEKKKVLVTYNAAFATGDDDYISGQVFSYVTKTGALWGGNIREAKFRFALPTMSQYKGEIIYMDGSPDGYRIDKGAISWTFNNWLPKEELLVRVEIGHLDMLVGIVLKEYFTGREYVADKRLYSRKDFEHSFILEHKSFAQEVIFKALLCWLFRNEIYARHGYKFDNLILKEFFSNFSWYAPKETFSETEFSVTEKRNLSIIKKEENELRRKPHIVFKF